METLVHLSWRLYVAVPLMALGAAVVAWGARRGLHGLLGAVRGDATRLIPFMEGFRATVIGLALIGSGAAWIWHLAPLLLISLVIGAGETMETSLILFALRYGATLEIGRPGIRTAFGHSPGQSHHVCATIFHR